MTLINYQKWLEKNIGSLGTKRIAVFGSTGGIGKELCQHILTLGGTLITVDRSRQKATVLTELLKTSFPNAIIHNLFADLEEIETVASVCDELERLSVDIIIHNAGAYSIPRKKCSTGFDNVFQINFVSPYYITNRLLPHLSARKGRVIFVGSIAHNYSKSDINDMDFSSRKKASLVYGNAKRYLSFCGLLLGRDNPEISFSLTHPGITFTNITAHYPKWIFAIIKHPMKIIFMPPKKAALSIMAGLALETECFSWIGPRLFGIWGLPSKKSLKTCPFSEAERIYRLSQQMLKERNL